MNGIGKAAVRNMDKKLPIGIQGFEKLRSDGFLYVDKTQYIYQLVHDNVPYFLSRPRRFGKSLLLSAMKAYWEGKKELFSGLAIEELEKDNPEAWKPYPVFYFDFNGVNYQEKGALEQAIDFQLREWEEAYNSTNGGGYLGERFQKLLKNARERMGVRCVILVDEYDKPLLDVAEKPHLQKHNKEVIKGFFSTMKRSDEYIQFIFITGISKFHKASIFSDLNHLRDISMTEDYAAMCGITEEEIDQYFSGEIDVFANRRNMTVQECREALRKQYDGYHFSPECEGVYNPYSLLGALLDKDLGSYWFQTGTPTFLIEQLRKKRFDVQSFIDQTIFASEAVLKDYTCDSLDPVPLLYQTGYLTITDYDNSRRRYTLGFPNEEVKCGFLESMIPAYVRAATDVNKLDIFT